jgi:AcrR family transcriptional regulator
LTGVLLRSIALYVSTRDPKQMILDAALTTFAGIGYERTTTADICLGAGVSNGALFHHFPTKDAIAEALYLRGIASYQDGLVRVIARPRGTDAARATIKAAVHHHLAWVEANRDLARFMYERGRPDWQPARGNAVRRLNRSTVIQIRDWIAPLAAAGAVRSLPLPVLAACVVGPAHFIAQRWVCGLITARPTSFTDELADAAWAALAPGKTRRSALARMSPAALIEASALEAANAACPASSDDAWTVIQLAMTSPQAAETLPVCAEVKSIRVEADGSIALVDVAVLDGGGRSAGQGHVVCLRRAKPIAPGERTRGSE